MIARALLCVALALLVAAGCSRVDTPENHLKRAEKLISEGEREGAVLELKNALQINPDFGEARYRLGTLYNGVRNGPAAESELRRAVKLNVILGGRVAAELGFALMLNQRPKEVLAEITPSDAYEPGALARIHAVRGRAHLALGQLEEAKRSAEMAQLAQADNPDAVLFSAFLRLVAGDTAGAVGLTDQVIARHPKELEAYSVKADILRQQGDNEGALALYRKMLEIDPRFTGARIASVAVLVQLRKLDEAQQELVAIQKLLRNNPVVAYQQGMIHFAKGKNREALEAVQASLKVAPDFASAQLLQGAIFLQLGSLAQAEHALSRFVAQNPRSSAGRNLLATTLVRLNQGKRALEVLEPDIGRDVRDKALLELAGDAYLQAGDVRNAIKSYQEASAKGDSGGRARRQLAMARLAAGERDQAIADLETAIGLDPASASADVTLVLTHMRAREVDKARDAAAKLVERQPKSAFAHNLLGTALLLKQDIAAAKAEFSKALELDPAFFAAAANLAQIDQYEKNPAAARKRFEGVLAKNPANVSAMLALSDLAASGGQFTEMVNWLERARKAQPTAIEPRARLVNHYVRTGDNARALQISQEAVSANPDHPLALDLLGTAHLAAGDGNSALAAYQRMVSVHPNYLAGYLKLARVQFSQKRSKEAESTLRTVLRLRPDVPEVTGMLVAVLASGPQTDEARKMLAEAKRKNPKSKLLLTVEGDWLTREGRLPEAVGAYRAAHAAQPGSDTALAVFQSMAHTKEFKKALAFMSQWVTDHPSDFASRAALADAYLQGGNTDEAILHYEKVLAQVPRHLAAMNNLASQYHKRKNPRGIELAETAYKLRPDMPAIADTYGWMLVDQGKFKEAVAILRKAAAGAARVPEVHYHLGVALAKAGDREGARAALEKALSLKRPFQDEEDARAQLKKL